MAPSWPRGYLDRDHSVAVRVLSRDPTERVHRIRNYCPNACSRAAQLRWLLLGPDGPLPCVCSRARVRPARVTLIAMGDFVVVQWYSSGALPWRDELLDAIAEAIHRVASTNRSDCAPWPARLRRILQPERVVEEPLSKW